MQYSNDGQWVWDGQQWRPSWQAPAVAPTHVRYSLDGQWWWDGGTWRPVQRVNPGANAEAASNARKGLALLQVALAVFGGAAKIAGGLTRR